ncbi:MAG: NAD-dependent epimerase/dehydratase family protein [Pseudomonadales bacterium]|jgi:nucleoside-diphosphate-sugar epimerase|nr:NAD-dependent epimerase/dehydratase family protein [Pseudomonadales bacterium]
MSRERTVLVAGASGVVGRAALERLAPIHRTFGLSPRRPDTDAGTHLAVDLTDAAATRSALADLPPVTHVVYAALYEKPGLLAGWLEADQMEINRAMLANCLDGLADHPVEHVSLLQGTKAYGAHVMRMRVPGREREPRVEHPNFYWLQEDLLRERAAARAFTFTLWRPPVIVGHALGAPMNVLAVLGAYAAITRETGEGFAFPGGACGPIDIVDARLLADAFAWALDARAARGATFNVTNGDVVHWPDLWPALAEALSVPAAAPEPRPLASWLAERAESWERIRSRDGLLAPELAAFTGDSPIYADMLFGYGRSAPPPPTFLSPIALRRAGFQGCIDSEDMFSDWISRLQQARLLPAAH